MEAAGPRGRSGSVVADTFGLAAQSAPSVVADGPGPAVSGP